MHSACMDLNQVLQEKEFTLILVLLLKDVVNDFAQRQFDGK